MFLIKFITWYLPSMYETFIKSNKSFGIHMGNCIDLNVGGNKIMQGGLFWRPHIGHTSSAWIAGFWVYIMTILEYQSLMQSLLQSMKYEHTLQSYTNIDYNHMYSYHVYCLNHMYLKYGL
jgi:hypothetical protein